MVEHRPYAPHSGSTSSATATPISRHSGLEDNQDINSRDRSPRNRMSTRRTARRSSQTSSGGSTSRSKALVKKQSKPNRDSQLLEPLSLGHSSPSITRRSRSDQESKRQSNANSHASDRKSVESSREPRAPHSSARYRSEMSSRDRLDRSGGRDRSYRSSESRNQSRMQPMNALSVLSLLSGITHATSSSSGSNSTITQNSYEKSRPSGHRRSPKPNRVHSEREWSERSLWPEISDQAPEHIDVFNYLETGSSVHEDGWLSDSSSSPSSSSSSSSSEDENCNSTLSTGTLLTTASSVAVPPAQESPSWNNRDQIHYDSGISICASSPESTRAVHSSHEQLQFESVDRGHEGGREIRQPPLAGVPLEVSDNTIPHQPVFSGTGLESFPPAYYPPPYMPPVVMYSRRPSDNSSKQSESPAPHKRKLLGYESLASQLSAHPHETETAGKTLTPLYRKFETLNHRILLHLQDEISELEDQLKSLDEYIALDPGQTNRPASRRSDLHHGNELHYRRTDLLGHIFLKTSQYNQALSAYTALTRNTTPASPTALAAYRAYLSQHTPIAAPETAFLDHSADLLAFSCACASPTAASASAAAAAAATTTTAITTSPTAIPTTTSDPLALLRSTKISTAALIAAAVLVLASSLLVLPLPLAQLIAVTVLAAAGAAAVWRYGAAWTLWERVACGVLCGVGCVVLAVVAAVGFE